MAEKLRLDLLLVERGLAPTRAKAQAQIMAGEVFVEEQRIDKPGTRFARNAVIRMKERPQYVSRGGDKLAGALRDFAFDCRDLICADVGASTGGFTDCLLQAGAQRVYTIDVGYGQLAHKLRIDARVINMERTNARHLERLPEPVNLVVVDASFISLRLLIPVFTVWLSSEGNIIALIKPQFEAGRDDVGKGGVVRRGEVHERVLQEVLGFALHQGLSLRGLTRSGLKGPSGNTEFLAWWSISTDNSISQEALDAMIQTVLVQS